MSETEKLLREVQGILLRLKREAKLNGEELATTEQFILYLYRFGD